MLKKYCYLRSYETRLSQLEKYKKVRPPKLILVAHQELDPGKFYIRC